MAFKTSSTGCYFGPFSRKFMNPSLNGLVYRKKSPITKARLKGFGFAGRDMEGGTVKKVNVNTLSRFKV